MKILVPRAYFYVSKSFLKILPRHLSLSTLVNHGTSNVASSTVDTQGHSEIKPGNIFEAMHRPVKARSHTFTSSGLDMFSVNSRHHGVGMIAFGCAGDAIARKAVGAYRMSYNGSHTGDVWEGGLPIYIFSSWAVQFIDMRCGSMTHLFKYQRFHLDLDS